MAMQIVVPDFSQAYTTAVVPLGTVAQDDLGNTYIFLAGVASTVVGSAVTYNAATFATTLTVAGSDGFVAFAMAATVAAQFGWYGIDGTFPCVAAAAAAANAAVFIVAASPGQVDDAVVATDRIENARFASTIAGAGAVAVGVTVHYPQAIALG
jgi:hypothetical protein